jgi:hypothetical protein
LALHRVRPSAGRRAGAAGLLVIAVLLFARPGPLEAQEVSDSHALFNWDLVSLEQNNPRFNGSVLSGFHSVRSPGVTPFNGWKTGLGILYTREEQISEATNSSLFSRNQVILNPKLNHGFAPGFEAGVGFAGSYTSGREIVPDGMGGARAEEREELTASSVDLGIKWSFFDSPPVRLGLAFDSRLALERGVFGALPANFFNIELDADYAFTSRFSLIGNLQYLTTDSARIQNQVLADVAAAYSFTDQFRGMLFGTVHQDELAATVLGFIGIAGQYIAGQHSFTLALDLLINDARRDIRTQEQFDIEVSYTFTF